MPGGFLRRKSTRSPDLESSGQRSLLMNQGIAPKQIIVRFATAEDRREIYRLRHEVYARELGQHSPSESGALVDSLDDFNHYIVAVWEGAPVGFISITSPGFGRYSVDKYLCRDNFPELQSERLFEIRLLTVLSRFRGREIAGLMMYAALRWIESQGGDRIVAIGRREVLDLYLHVGLERLGHEIRAGAVTYELLAARVSQMMERTGSFAALLNRLERVADWQLGIPFRKSAACFHGGAFFDAIGPAFDHLERRKEIINADVLDAWFPPSPKVIAALQEELPWLLRTSPPAAGEGMVRTIAQVRGVPPECILPAAGSSDAIFLALRHWLDSSSRVLLLDPTYGEYAHVLEQVIHCQVDRLVLDRRNDYRLDLAEFESSTRREYDLIVLVNPNSPTGQHVPRTALETVLRRVPEDTLVWIDETYVEYAGAGESLESFAAGSRNVVVCKSMSKVYALSGARAAYLCGPRRLMEELRAITPPWAVSLLAQLAAVRALQDPDYYSQRYEETHRLRRRLAGLLATLNGWNIIPGTANFLLCHLPEHGMDAATLVKASRAQGLFLRDAGVMGRNLGARAIRIAVKDAATIDRMTSILARICKVESNREGAVICC
jgi:histidinol-phosphate/aromatic aminotransferase/cobyric acid decarboxylase-like protein